MTLRDRYPEMGTDGDDPALQQLIGDLDRLGKQSRASTLPPQDEMRIVHALKARAAARRSQNIALSRTRSLFRRHRPLALVAAVGLSILMVLSAAYAAAPVLSRVFDLGGASNVIQQNLGTEVDLSQTLAGYTMTIKRVYADPNRILIAYSIRPPATGHRLWNISTGNLTLTDPQGSVLPERSLVADGVAGEPETTLQGFDAAPISGDPNELHVHLTVPWIEAMEQLHATPGPGQPSGDGFPGLPLRGAFGAVAIARPVGDSDPWMQIVRTYGPISFNLTIPFDRGQSVTPHQAVQAAGVTATLERVEISPTETRLYVSGLEPNTFGSLSATSGGANDVASAQWSWHGMTVYSFYADFMDRRGDWSFTVKPMPPLRLPPGTTPPPGSAPAEGGPWTFHFAVP
jgi:Domain of unknown function (DUF4179)